MIMSITIFLAKSLKYLFLAYIVPKRIGSFEKDCT